MIWDFGDGSPTVAATNPAHVYAQARAEAYIVRLLAKAGNQQSEFEYPIRVTSPPVIAPPIDDQSATENSAIRLKLTNNERDSSDEGTLLTWDARLIRGRSLI